MSPNAPPSPLVVVAFQSGAQANGGLESLVRIVEALPREVIALTDREGDVAERMRAAGREVHAWELRRIEHHGRFERLAGRALRAPALGWFNDKVRRLVVERGAGLLLANDIRSFWHAAPGSRAAGARVVFTVRDMFLPGRPYGAKWRLTRHLADVVVTLSESMRRETLERIRPYGGQGAAVEAIYSIVPHPSEAPATADERALARRQLGLPVEGPLFAVVGSFCDKKNQLELLERAAGPLLLARPDSTLVFVGDFEPSRDPYARRCAEVARALPDPSRIRFAGFSRDVRSFYRAADVTCVASRYEGLARAMIESLAAGTPVVSFDVTSAREILEGRGTASAQPTGRVRAQGDYRGLVADLVELAADPAATWRLGAAGVSVARRLFSSQHATEAYERLFRALDRRSTAEPA